MVRRPRDPIIAPMQRTVRRGLRLLLRDEDPAWDRLLRRRLMRAERDLPLSLTIPVSREAMMRPLPAGETIASGPRPLPATLAALLLWTLGAALAALAVVELGPPIVGVLAEEPVDGLSALFAWLIAAFFAGVLAAFLLVAVGHGYAGWRIIEGVNWGFVEGLAMAVVGLLLGTAHVGLDLDGRFAVTPALVGVVAGYLAVVGLLLAARQWFGEIRFPLHPDRAPWWLRLGRRVI